MARVPDGVKHCREFQPAEYRRANVTDDSQTARRQMDGRQHIANANMSSCSVKSNEMAQPLCHLAVDWVELLRTLGYITLVSK